jgi:hypothetical protein
VARYLALDWDQNQLHLVAGSIRGSKVTIERAAVWQEEFTPPSADPEALGRALRERLKTSRIAAAPVLVSLARDRVILKDIRFPTVPEAEEAGLVRFQAVKELTDAGDEVVIDYTTITDRSAPEQRALALIARKDVVNAYQALCHAAGLKLAAITPRPFGSGAAARRSMSVGGALTPPPDPPDAAVAVVTIADKWAEFCVIRGTSLLLARTLAVGPPLAGEIRRNLTVYNGQNPQRPVQSVYLSAGPHVELRQRLGELVDVPIYPYDPLAGAEVEVPGTPGGFAGAAGLLFARAESGRLPINFIDPRKSEEPPSPYRARILMGVAAALLVFLALFFTGRHVLANLAREADAADAEKAALDKQAAAKKDETKRTKALHDLGVPVWPDELYDLTDRIKDVNQVRITQLTAAPPTRTGKTASPYAARLTIEGEFLDPQRGRQALDDFVAQFRSESDREYYILEGPPVVKNNNRFSFTVQIKRRPPGSYTRVLKLEP